MITHLEPTTFAKSIVLEAADIPPDMTIAQWRMQKLVTAAGAQRASRRRSGRRWRFKRG